jgi:DNA polymerase I
LSSIKSAGGKPTEYYKASTDLLAKYCIQDCMLTYKLYVHYSKELSRQGLDRFFYSEEVMPLYREVVIPMEVAGVRLDMQLLRATASELERDIRMVESAIQAAILPHLDIFRTWFLNKDFPLQTPKGKVPNWAKKGVTQQEAWAKANPGAFMFNLESKHHLKKLFFDTLGEKAISHTDLGNPQVDNEFLEKMSLKHVWVGDLITFNKLRKLQGTYVQRFIDDNEDGRLYPSYACHRTVSGRLAGDFQQLPRPIEGEGFVSKYTSVVRRFIKPSPGSVLCSADYNQLEPSIFAHASGDSKLQLIFTKGYDFYSEVAIMTEHLAGVSSDKSAPNYLGKVNKAARQKAKAYSLGIAYGMTGYKLQFEIGVPQDEAERLVQAYLHAFPDLASWMVRSQDDACYHGRVRTQTGRVRHLRMAQVLFAKYGARLRDSLQLWKDYHDTPDVYAQAKADRKTYINQLNNAINFQIQGLAASIMNRAAISIARHFKQNSFRSKIVGQIHDELLFDVDESERIKVAEVVKHIMENVYPLTVPLVTVPQFGASYAECK